MRIDNSQISDLSFDDTTQLETGMGMSGVGDEVLREAYAHVSPDGQTRVGLHHELRPGEEPTLILNRSGVYRAMGDLEMMASARDRQLPDARAMTRRQMVAAMQHLQRHAKAMQDVPIYEGETVAT